MKKIIFKRSWRVNCHPFPLWLSNIGSTCILYSLIILSDYCSVEQSHTKGVVYVLPALIESFISVFLASSPGSLGPSMACAEAFVFQQGSRTLYPWAAHNKCKNNLWHLRVSVHWHPCFKCAIMRHKLAKWRKFGSKEYSKRIKDKACTGKSQQRCNTAVGEARGETHSWCSYCSFENMG